MIEQPDIEKPQDYLKDRIPEPVLGGWFTTYSGKKWYILEPRPEDVNIKDIAHALSLICRFGGHSRNHYSVGDHSVMCRIRAIELWPTDWMLQLHILLHDASEAYIGDMVRPMKETMPAFNALEDKTQTAIYIGLGLPKPTDAEYTKIKRVDNELLMAERRDIINNGGHEWNIPAEAWDFPIGSMTPEQSESAFLKMYGFLRWAVGQSASR